jgi:hypothetical protein
MKEKSKHEDLSHLGVADFLKFMYDGHPDWSLLAIKAPIEEVSEEFADFRGADTLLRDVPRKPAEAYEDVASLVSVVQVKGNPWVVVFRSLLYVDARQLEGIVEEAKELSGRLSTRAIAFVGEDTSGALSYDLFEQGKVLESAEWEVGGEFSRFKSSLRKRPAQETVGDEFADGVFREQGIYLPCCYPKSEGGEAWLAVEKISDGVIERADLIELGKGDDTDDDEQDRDET